MIEGGGQFHDSGPIFLRANNNTPVRMMPISVNDERVQQKVADKHIACALDCWRSPEVGRQLNLFFLQTVKDTVERMLSQPKIWCIFRIRWIMLEEQFIAVCEDGVS